MGAPNVSFAKGGEGLDGVKLLLMLFGRVVVGLLGGGVYWCWVMRGYGKVKGFKRYSVSLRIISRCNISLRIMSRFKGYSVLLAAFR